MKDEAMLPLQNQATAREDVLPGMLPGVSAGRVGRPETAGAANAAEALGGARGSEQGSESDSASRSNAVTPDRSVSQVGTRKGAHLGDVIDFETAKGMETGRLCRALGGQDYVVEMIRDKSKYRVKYLADQQRWVLPHLVEPRV